MKNVKLPRQVLGSELIKILKMASLESGAEPLFNARPESNDASSDYIAYRSEQLNLFADKPCFRIRFVGIKGDTIYSDVKYHTEMAGIFMREPMEIEIGEIIEYKSFHDRLITKLIESASH